MDWFLYDNGLRHEKVKMSAIMQKKKMFNNSDKNVLLKCKRKTVKQLRQKKYQTKFAHPYLSHATLIPAKPQSKVLSKLVSKSLESKKETKRNNFLLSRVNKKIH